MDVLPLALPLTLDRGSAVPLGTQVSGAIRDLVTSGRLHRGDRLPSSRALARDTGVARSVVEQAYAQLVAEGWLEGRHGSGTYVAADRAPGPSRPVAPSPGPVPDRDLVRLDAGTPWIDPRHSDAWRRAWREVGHAPGPRGYDDPRGMPVLREALAERLTRTRGLVVDADDVRITAGTTDGLRHLLAGLPPGTVLVDDPGYRAAVETIRASGRDVVDHPAGTPVHDLTGSAAAYSTPAHQHPLGPPISGPDRLSVLEAARRAGAVVVEDDYDSEFRYDVAPIPALASLDRDVVAYLGTASKAVAPSLRLGWMVVPPSVREAVDRHRSLTHDTASWPVQRAFWALLRDGYVDRLVRSARRTYARRAARVADALGPWLEGPPAGMYATVLLPPDLAVAAHRRARAGGFDVPLLSDYTRSSTLTGLVVGFGGCTDDELDRALDLLSSAVRA